MESILINICILLDESRKEKCIEFFDEYNNLFFLFINSPLIYLISLLIIFIIYKILFSTNIKHKDLIILTFANFFILLFIFIAFRTNIPWVDDWEWIENLQTNEKSTIEWLTQKANIHNIFITKFVFLILHKFFSFKIEYLSILSIFLFLFISLIIISKKQNIDNFFLIIIILSVFSAKQFANISQASNIAWTISFFLIVIFRYSIIGTDKKYRYLNIFLIFFAPLTFGLGYIIPLFVILFINFINITSQNKLIYFIFSILSILFSQYLSQIFFQATSFSIDYSKFITLLYNYKFYLTFLGVLSNIYLPWINGLAVLGVIISIIQIGYIINKEYANYKIYHIASLRKFLNENIFINLGLIFAFLVACTRAEFQTIVAARYSVGSIIFQIGFWTYFAKNSKEFINSKKLFFKLISIYIFVSGIFYPYQGFHWQVKRYYENQKIISCYKLYEADKCSKLAYDILFYGGKWYDFDNFKFQLKSLENNNKSFFK